MVHETVTHNYYWRVFTWKEQAEGRKAAMKDWWQRQSWLETHPVVRWFASHCIDYCRSSYSTGLQLDPILIRGRRASQSLWYCCRSRRADSDAETIIKILTSSRGQMSPEKCDHCWEVVRKWWRTYFQEDKLQSGHRLLRRWGPLFHKRGYCYWCFHMKNMLQQCLRRPCQSSQTSRSIRNRHRRNRNWIT